MAQFATDSRGFWPQNSALANCAVLSLAVPEVRAARALGRPSADRLQLNIRDGADGAKGDLTPRPKRLMELRWAWTRASASRTARRAFGFPRDRTMGHPSADLLRQLDDDSRRAAHVAEPVAVVVVL